MEQVPFTSYTNVALVEGLYARYREDPSSVDPSWQYFFDGMEFALRREGGGGETSDIGLGALKVYALLQAYRTYGHLLAHFNVIDAHPVEAVPELALTRLGFEESDRNRTFPTCGILCDEEAPLFAIIAALEQTYCGKTGVEYMGLGDPEMERWLQQEIEPTRFAPQMSIDDKRRILDHLNKAELFELFLHTKYVGQKRFSLEGGENLIPVLETVIEEGGKLGVSDVLIGMAHRGRLNVLTNILNKSYASIFHEFEDHQPEASWDGSGDVKYHKGFSSDVVTQAGDTVHLNLAANPSHLESVDPVVEGKARAKQVLKGDDKTKAKVVPILIHGDAAVAGQGVVYETMQMCRLPGYCVGGTIHIVINNQVGFTTLPADDRSTRYCTDLARTFSAPVFHVNGEDAEGCAYAARLAVQLRKRFGCDVFIDLNCYRKYGHNEADEPAFTQPLEYKIIRSKESPRVLYRDQLIEAGVIERQIAEELEAEFRKKLQEQLDEVQTVDTKPEPTITPEKWRAIRDANVHDDPFGVVNTAIPIETLQRLAHAFTAVPDGFYLHRKLQRLVSDRKKMVEGDPSEATMNWGMAEHLAFAALLDKGVHVRLAGQDARRGTFNHRHAMWMDQEKEGKYFPLNHIRQGQGRFDVFNSLLSEYAALGFEYGYSLAYPDALVIWEAQFGDFANTAQVVFDQYLSASEQKWGEVSGLVMLLPHGYEGQGPEHSSGRMERFLQGAAERNWQVANVTTPAQIFHLLRRQVLRTSRKPLLIFSPKSLLGHPKCVSSLNDLAQGQFYEILDDPESLSQVRQLVFCTGRIYYDLIEQRQARSIQDTAIVRVEQLYPFDVATARALMETYAGFERCVWVQEEPSNMGAWDFIRHLLRKCLPDGMEPVYVGRDHYASPATGSPTKHKSQQAAIYDALFG